MNRTMLAWTLLTCGCSSSPPPAEEVPCNDAGIDLACTPAYEPTYEALYANTFHSSCAAPGFACHASTGRQGNIDFSTIDQSYADLTERAVKPGSPECSIIAQRIVATSGKVRMPPGRSLPAGEQCAIIQWIARGAKR